MKSFAFAAVVASVSAIEQMQLDFFNYVAKYGKSYSEEKEFAMRLNRYVEVDQFIRENNRSGASHTAAHNKFSDFTFAEYKAMMGYRNREEPVGTFVNNGEASPASVDWVAAGGVTPIKDQGQCGSCWSFSTTGSLEGAHYVAAGELLSFSEQHLVDCAGFKYGNLGCNGGLASNSYNYYMDGYYAILESDYPYVSGTTMKKGECQYDSVNKTDVTVQSYTEVTPNNVADMKAALAQQPLAVAIEADKLVFQTYSTGILDSDKCGTNLDHAVLAVGYGVDNGVEYWTVKNSWGTGWGDNGFIRLAITGDDAGICGVQSEPEFPVTN